MEGRWRTRLAGKVAGARRGDDIDLALLPLAMSRNGERHGAVAHARYHVDAVHIEPSSRDSDADIRFVLMVRGNDLDLAAQNGPKSSAAILAAATEPGPDTSGVRPCHILKDADAQRRIGGLRPDRQKRNRQSHDHLECSAHVSPVACPGQVDDIVPLFQF